MKIIRILEISAVGLSESKDSSLYPQLTKGMSVILSLIIGQKRCNEHPVNFLPGPGAAKRGTIFRILEAIPRHVKTNRGSFEMASVLLKTTPAKLETIPAELKTTPAKLETIPAELKTNPARLETNPAKLETNPAKLETNPAKLETNPARLKTIPARLETIPARLETNPAKLEKFPEVLNRRGKSVEYRHGNIGRHSKAV